MVRTRNLEESIKFNECVAVLLISKKLDRKFVYLIEQTLEPLTDL